MPSLLHCTGPTHIYAKGRSSAASWLYVGTAVTSPAVEADPAYIQVMNDVSGRSKPHQLIYDGETHALTVTFNRFDYNVWKALRDAYSHSTVLADHGYDGRFERGNLVLGAGDFELALAYDYGGTPAATVGLPLGRWYASAVVGAYREDTAGTRVMEISARFDCNAIYNPATREHWLYSEAVLPTLPSPS